MLTIKPRGFDLAVNCRSDNHAHARWDFILDSVSGPRRKATGASCNGFLVQKVSVSCDVTACDFSKKYFTHFEYWEAWPVKRGEKTSTIKKANNYKYTDEASYNFPAGSFGWYHQRGEVRFYCAKDFGTDGWFECGLVPYGGDGPCGTTAGLLKSTPDPPRSWSKGGAPIDEGPAFRNFEVEWCCCSCPSLRCNQASATAAPQ